MKKNRLLGIDLIKIFFALMVFCFHCANNYKCNFGIMHPFVSVVGGVVMTGFFSLSGYSLFFVYKNTDIMNKDNMKKFYFNRIIGIMPLYIFIAIIYIIRKIYLNGICVLIDNIILFPVEITMTQSTFNSLFSWTHNGGTWFVSCIMLCYFCFPLLMQIMNNGSKKSNLVIFIIITILLLYQPFVVHYCKISRNYSNPFFRILEFWFGMILSFFSSDLKRLSHIFTSKWMIIIEVLMLILGISLMQRIIGTNYMLYSWIMLPILLFLLPQAETIVYSGKWYDKVIRFFAKLSYAFYLCQFFVWAITRKLATVIGINSNTGKIVSSLVVCTILSSVVHLFFEEPIKRYVRFQKKYH